jgi:murein DD-endopeptidase MepM/ murein hydrolase activator NlpD
MATMRHLLLSRVALRFALAAGAAATISGCSDASRFASDPFSDPFGGSTRVARAGRPIDNVSTGSIPGSSPAPVQSQSLAAPSATASAQGSLDHWTAQGGTPVTLAEGETPETVANRYGVPAEVLVRVNGFSSASEVTPGSRLVIPVYRANKAIAAAPKPAAAAPHQVAEAPQAAPAPAASAKVATAPAKPAPAAKPAQPVAVAAVKPAPAKPAVAQAKPAVAQGKLAVAQGKPAVAAAKLQPVAPAKPQAVVQKAAQAPAQAAHAPKAPPAAAASVASASPPPAIAPAPAAPPPAAVAPKAQVAQAQQKDDEPSPNIGSGAHPEFRWPARGRVIQTFTSGGNDGINIALPEGTQVKAAEAGVVAYAGNGLKGYGNLVLIKHPNGFVSAYAHNGEISVKAGDQVTRGQTIAKSGQTGDVPTPQLHFELRKGKTPVDPMGYLASL